MTEHPSQEAVVTHVVLAPLSSSPPPAVCARFGTLGKGFQQGHKWAGGLWRGRGAARLPLGVGSSLHTPTFRITPTEPPHFPCVLSKCKTGTEVLRKDKGGGRGRWPGFSPRHKGRLSEGGKTWTAEHTQHRACASEEPVAAGRGQPGATRFPISARSLGRQAAASGSRNLSFAVCEALPQPTASSSICQEKDLLNASPI